MLRKGLHQVRIAGTHLTFKVRDGGEIGLVDWFRRGERALMHRILDAVQDGDTVFDVGASIGLVSVLLAVAGQRSGVTVHAFEPNPDTAEHARENAALNRCDNVVVHQIALAARCGLATLHTNTYYRASDSMIPVETIHTDVVEVLVESADSIMRRLGIQPDIMKIDVEGAELDVILGSEEILTRGLARELFVEIHPQRLAVLGYDEGTVVSRLVGHGYRSVWRHVRDGEVHHHFRRTTACGAHHGGSL